MPPEIQRLRDAAELWRSQHKAADDSWCSAVLARDAAAESAADVERRALAVAIKAIDLCISRRVVPRLEAPDGFVVEVVIPPKRSPIEHAQLSLHSHGPVVVECECGCLTTHAALDLVDEAHRASEYALGWASLFVRLWVDLLRHECERALATPPQKHEGPRLVVAPEQDGETPNEQ